MPYFLQLFSTINLLIIIKILFNYQKTFSQAANIDDLSLKSNIYYQPLQFGAGHRAPREYLLEELDVLEDKSDLKLLIHGFLGNRWHSSVTPLKQAYLAQGKTNVFIADWQQAANLDYASSRNSVAKVAFNLAKILETFLSKHRIDVGEVHVIGHSLGAHIAGGIGLYFNGTLGRVTGLDPALPLFTPKSIDGLHAESAIYVDVIHTDYPIFGDITPRGIIDFYPNYGLTPQKGCDSLDLLTASKLLFEAVSCSHNRAVLLYAETISSAKNFPAIPCSLENILNRNARICQQHFLGSRFNENGSATTQDIIAEQEDYVYMGEMVSKTARGTFYLETYDVPPFGMGLQSVFK